MRGLPAFVAHADWGSTPRKRWLARARREPDDGYLALPPEAVGEPETLLRRLRSAVGADDAVLVGFDFPIGVPHRYAAAAGVSRFLDLLPELGEGEWSRFYEVAEAPAEITPARPFYPRRPGGTGQRHLLAGLGAEDVDELRRECELASPSLPAASPLFWTLGAKQVGKAAISGWRDVLAPALADDGLDVAIWPFAGPLEELVAPGRLVVVETYPAEFYRHLGVTFSSGSKRNRGDRAANAPELSAWCARTRTRLAEELWAGIKDGFGHSHDGEDRFDAVVGLLGILNVLVGHRPSGDPVGARAETVEGWILGRLRERAS